LLATLVLKIFTLFENQRYDEWLEETGSKGLAGDRIWDGDCGLKISTID